MRVTVFKLLEKKSIWTILSHVKNHSMRAFALAGDCPNKPDPNATSQSVRGSWGQEKNLSTCWSLDGEFRRLHEPQFLRLSPRELS